MTILGANKQNPYTVSNMAAAWQSLASKGVTTSASTNVHTTHYYVKFKPQNFEQYEKLQKDTTLHFSDLPIESTVIQNGDYYHDPSLPDSVPTFQYTAVPVGYQFSSEVPYQILSNLYIPEQDNTLDYRAGSSNELFVDKLLNQAYTQTGNTEDVIATSGPNARSWYIPNGRIQVFDTRLGVNIGMQGVRVEARRWFTVFVGIPNYNGNYDVIGAYKRPCNYSIWFASPLFSVRQRLINTTFWVNGPKQSSAWNYTLNDSYQRFAGHVFRGAYRYHFRNIGGLLKPLLPLGRQLYIALDKAKDWSGINYQPLPYLRVARYELNGTLQREYDSDEIFSTTCHETAHSSHYSHVGLVAYIGSGNQIRESWAVGVEWYLTHIEYADRGIRNYGDETYAPVTTLGFPNQFAYQFWNNTQDADYTSLFINLVDTFNEVGQIFPRHANGVVIDQVSGYSLPFLESSVLPYAGWGKAAMQQRLKNVKPAGITDFQIDMLFDFY